jgi:hypothetical protein
MTARTVEERLAALEAEVAELKRKLETAMNSAPGTSEEDAEWRQFGLEQFLQGYAEEDAVYDRFDELSGR